MNSVTVTGPGTVVGSYQSNGMTWYLWAFPVVINGQAGVITVSCESNDPANEAAYEAALIEFLENDPDADDDLGGIAENDPGTDEGDSIFISDDGDTAVASNDGGDSGDSV